MKFAFPGFLFALFTVIVPIFLHFYHLRKYKRSFFTNLRFIKQIEQQTKAVKRLKHLLVLAARCLVLIFVVLAFAQPFTPAIQSGKNGSSVIAIHIDNSFSMTLKGTEGSLLSESKESAINIVKNSDASTRFLITTNALNGEENNLCSKADALERIEKLEITAISRNIGNVLNWQKERLDFLDKEKERIGVRHYVSFSDFQKNSSTLESLRIDELGNYHPVIVKAQKNQNLYIDSVWFSNPFRKVGIVNTLNIRVCQTGNNSVSTEISAKIGDLKRDLFVEFKDKTPVVLTLSFNETSPGWKNGVIKVRDSDVTFDDEYFFSYEVKKQLNILVVEGESSNKGVAIVYGLDPFFNVETVSSGALNPSIIAEKDLIVLNGLNDFPTGTAEQLLIFSEQGGSVLLFPGENAILPSWNASLMRLQMPQLGSVQSNATKIKNIEYQDRFFEGVFEKKPDQLNVPSFSKTYPISGNSNTRSLLKLQNGSAVFVASAGSKSIYLLGASLAESFGTFTSNALFSTILLRCGELSQANLPLSLFIGKEADLSIRNLKKSEQAIHLKNKSFDFIPQRLDNGAKTIFSLEDQNAQELLKPGIATLENESKIAEIALNYSRSESNCISYTDKEVRAQFELKGITNVQSYALDMGANLLDIKLQKPKEYWRICLFLALLFLVIEIFLIKLLK